MTSPRPFTPRSVCDGMAALYGATGTEAARLRGAQLNAVVRLTPFTMVANVGSASVVLWVFRGAIPPGMWLWWLVILAMSGLAAFRWWRMRAQVLERASRRALHHATLQAALLSGAWAFMLIWFPAASTAQQLALATLVTGMLGAGTFVLASLPWACMAYAAIYMFASTSALWLAGDPLYAGVAVLLMLYTPTVVLGALFSWHKGTAQFHAEAQAVQRERLLAVLLQDFEQHAGEALWEFGRDGCVSHPSPRLAELLEAPEAEFRRQPLVSLIARRSPLAAAALQQALDAGRPFRDLPLTLNGPGGPRHLKLNGKGLLDEEGRLQGWRGVMADATDTVEGERRLRELASTDSLTGLANRLTLRQALSEQLREGRRGALLSIDLDRFKAVNDSLGHSAGDELLKLVAERLRACLRPGDLIARLGGDEFAVLMAHSDQRPDASALAERLIKALAKSFDLQDRHQQVGASVGVALLDGSVAGVDELLVQADTALYDAKAAGRGRHTVYSDALGERSRRRLDIEHGLRQAIAQGELALHWQPKVHIRDWRIAGAEALMRWRHPLLGPISPLEFIPVAEQCGLIGALGQWGLREACRAAAGPLAGLRVSVNVSALQLQGTGFVASVREALEDHGLPPGMLELEITESVFIDDAQGALSQLHALHALGVQIALDDFGTGYSSLAYLRRFPFDTLKIDRAFVNEVLLREDARIIVRTIAQMATALGMSTVCEGVESAQQLAAVSQAGCEQVQGYLVSKPRTLAEFVQLRSEWLRSPPVSAQLH
ncbi:MAG TPA: EAL domain-containing protein [Ideonella sp.]|uniref:putative bifunctional diguanylate cyclase/phosphodiesterase n=1 Tax=Ideonella sp. TaxID=1929293 RepID=UPI002BC90CDE|nr:EAL domain-containing protein [Ideonella sp.]HSI47742.1 EAL domain-containing protein [Ideonella sp.]